MKIVAIIPARLASTRLNKKLLIKFNNLEMIEHVRRRAILSKAFEEVYVATGDDEIERLIKNYKGNVIRTYKSHPNGTSRAAEAIKNIDASHLVLIQGDEPLILPNSLRQMVNFIRENPNYEAINAIANIEQNSDLDDCSQVKCAINKNGRILYCFRKSPSNCFSNKKYIYIKKMLGLIGYKREILNLISNSEESVIQSLESIEQLWFMENNYDIHSIETESCIPSVNLYSDIEKVVKYIKKHRNQQILIEEVLNLNQSL